MLPHSSSLNWSRVLVLTVIFACVGARAEAQTSFVFEAEYYTTKSSLDSGTSNWTLSTTEAGYSGTGYIEGTPSSAFCTATPPVSCGADMTFDFTVTVPGTYYVHFLVNSASSGRDSLHWGIDGSWLEDPNTDTVYGSWVWETMGVQTGSLTAATHTLNVWMREGGQKIDKVVIDLSATPPVDAPVVEDFSVAAASGSVLNIWLYPSFPKGVST